MIHFFGCSLTYCSEISDIDIIDPDADDLKYTWPVVLGHKLNFEDHQIKNWARPGASCRDIALTAIEAMHKHDGVFVICWTWPERTNYWDPEIDMSINQPGLTITFAHLNKNLDRTTRAAIYPESINHFVKFDGERNWSINFLMNFQLVNATAIALKKRCIHIQVGETIFFLNEKNWFDTQTIPNQYYTEKRLAHTNNKYLMYMPTFNQHYIFTNWLNADVLFKSNPLWYYVKNVVDNNPLYYSGTHWSRQGCALVADVLYDKLLTSFQT